MSILNPGFETSGSSQRWFTSFGTDATGTLNAWNNPSTWSITSNVVASPASNAITTAVCLTGGHADWTDYTYTVRCQWGAGQVAGIIGRYNVTTGVNGYLVQYQNFGGNSVQLYRLTNGAATSLGGAAHTATGTFIWLRLVFSGTSISAYYADDSSGSPGSYTLAKTATDSTYGQGQIALRASSVAAHYGGAFTNVATVDATGPANWAPLVTAGEPAFAWTKVTPHAGTYAVSINNLHSSGDGSWEQDIAVPAGSITGTIYGKTTAGTAVLKYTGAATGSSSGASGSYTQLSNTQTATAATLAFLLEQSGVGIAYFDDAVLTTTSVQTQTGKSRITATATQTQTGKSRVTATTTKTQTGKSRVQQTATKTQTGKARVTATTTRTQPGVARVQITTTRTQPGVSRVQQTVPRTTTGKSRIQATATKTQPGVSRIQVTTTRTQTGLSRVQVSTSRTQPGKASIVVQVGRTITGQARIFKVVSFPQRVVTPVAGAQVTTKGGPIVTPVAGAQATTKSSPTVTPVVGPSVKPS